MSVIYVARDAAIFREAAAVPGAPKPEKRVVEVVDERLQIRLHKVAAGPVRHALSLVSSRATLGYILDQFCAQIW